MTAEPMFPILNDPIIKAIPWAAIAPHEQQAQRNHSQSLNRLASRGGLSVCEALAVMQDEPWKKRQMMWARAKLLCLIVDFERAAVAPRQDEAAEEMITMDGTEYRKFIRYPEEITDGTLRCISCGQIDEPEYHDDNICPHIPSMEGK